MKFGVLLLTLASGAQGQGFFERSRWQGFSHGGATVSSSFVSSSFWSSSSDGVGHQETHQVKQETFIDPRTGNLMQQKESEVNCRDGNCMKSVHVQAPMGVSSQWMPRLRGMMPSMPSHRFHWAFSHPPVIHQQPVVIAIRASPGPAFLAPRPPPTVAEVQAQQAHNASTFAATAVFASCVGALAIAALFKIHRQSQVSAREKPMRSLAQPLADDAEAAIIQPSSRAIRSAAQPAVQPENKFEQAFMLAVYERAAGIADLRHARSYLSRVYAKQLC